MSQCDRPTAKASAKPSYPPAPKLPTSQRPDPKANPKANPKSPESLEPAPKTTAKPKRNPKGRKLGVGGEAGQTSGAEPETSEDGPWEGVIKRVQIAGPHLLASLKGINTGVEYGLIDGGATRCLRYGPPGEYKGARPVEVHLASGSTQELRMSPVGTLLSSDPSIQPILPMGPSELKSDIHWVGSTCSIQHPEHGQLQVIVNRNCPEIQASMCLELISEVARRRAGAMMSAMREVKDHVVGSRGWKEMPEKDFLVAIWQWTGDEFSEVPVRIQERITPAKTHVASESGLNRHTRRKLERGSAFLHLFAGVQRWDHPGQVPSLSIDLERGLDLHDDALYWYLLQLARHGDVS